MHAPNELIATSERIIKKRLPSQCLQLTEIYVPTL